MLSKALGYTTERSYQLMMQAHKDRDKSREHEHRNLTRIRPYKS